MQVYYEANQSQANLPEIIKNLLTPSQQLLLNAIVTSANVHQRVMPSHTYLSQKISRCRRTIIRGMIKLKSLGLLSWVKRGYKKTNWYKLCPDFFDLNIREALSHYLPACGYSPKALYKALRRNVTLCYLTSFKTQVLDSNVPTEINNVVSRRVTVMKKVPETGPDTDRQAKERKFLERLEEERRNKRNQIIEQEESEMGSILSFALSIGRSLL